MDWNELPDFQKLMGEYADLEKNAQHRSQFEAFLARMWTSPENYEGLLQAYLEFLIPDKPQYKRLNGPEFKQQEQSNRKKSRSRSSRRRRRGGRRRSKRRQESSS